MQHSVGSFDHSFGAHQAGSRTEEGEEFGGASALILMWVSGWMAFRLRTPAPGCGMAW